MLKNYNIKNSEAYFKIKFIRQGDETEYTLNVKDIDEDNPYLIACVKENFNIYTVTKVSNGTYIMLLDTNIDAAEITELKVCLKDQIKYDGMRTYTKKVYHKKLEPEPKVKNVEQYTLKPYCLLENQFDESGINHLYYYNPNESNLPGTKSYELLLFKRYIKYPSYKNEKVFSDYLRDFKIYIIAKLKHNENVALVCAPNSNATNINESSISLLIDKLCDEYGSINGKNVLLRYKSVEPSHLNIEKRTIQKHINSIAINDSHLIKGKYVILLDDVYVSGSTLGACKDILLKNGAKKVVLFSISYSERK